MFNWSTDEKNFKKKHPKEYRLWRLTQLINYGLDEGEKLDRAEVKKAWPEIKDKLDPDRKKTVEFFIWGKQWHLEPGLLPDRSNFWQWYFKSLTS
ncbi:MAG: hypothetical protein U1C50_03275 [Patescibacteria group bacterium]|nr:hypothetical protein [Patescibacteria group bacterium]